MGIWNFIQVQKINKLIIGEIHGWLTNCQDESDSTVVMSQTGVATLNNYLQSKLCSVKRRVKNKRYIF